MQGDTMIDDRDENLTRSGARTRNAGDLEGQNVRTHDQGMRIRGSGRDREDTSRYGRSDDDRTGRSARDEEWEMRQGRPYDDDRGYSWHQDRDPSRFDEGFRGRSWDDTQRSAQGGDRYGRDDRGYGGRGDDRMHTSVDAGRGYREDRDLAGTSGRLGHDPERDYGRGGPIGGGTGYGGRQYEGTERGDGRGQRYGQRDLGAGYSGSRDEAREMYGGQRDFVRGDQGRGRSGGEQRYGNGGHGGQHGRYDMGPGPYGQGQYGQGQYGQGQYGQGQYGQGQLGQGQYGQGQLGQGQYGQGQYGQGQVGQRSWRGEPQMGQRRGPMNYQRSDQRIYEDVCDRLSDDDDLDVSNVEVKVDKGEVTVTGHVESRAMKRRIEDVVERVSGVKDVHVQVKVQRQGERDQNRTGTQTSGQTGVATSSGNADKAAKPGAQGHTTSS
jgi:osmotically-inducible protein OsmY